MTHAGPEVVGRHLKAGCATGRAISCLPVGGGLRVLEVVAFPQGTHPQTERVREVAGAHGSVSAADGRVTLLRREVGRRGTGSLPKQFLRHETTQSSFGDFLAVLAQVHRAGAVRGCWRRDGGNMLAPVGVQRRTGLPCRSVPRHGLRPANLRGEAVQAVGRHGAPAEAERCSVRSHGHHRRMDHVCSSAFRPSAAHEFLYGEVMGPTNDCALRP